MGRGNSHRERERHGMRHAVDSWDEALPAPTPSYARPSVPLEAGTEVAAEVKWFNPEKGFGFVALVDGSGEAFLPGRAVEAAGHKNLDAGATIVARITSGPKGQQVAAIIRVDSSSAQPEARRPHVDRPSFLGRSPRAPNGAAPDPKSASPDRDGVVKWFDPVKGFGFVSVENEPKDLFVHISVLQRSGLESLDPGQPVRVTVVAGRKGDEIGALSLP